MKVSKNLYQITLPTPFGIGPVHTYVLVEDTITLFDAGVSTEAAWNSFNEQLSKLNLKVENIDQIILTHHHPDHTGLISYFSDSIPIAGHSNLQPWLTRDVTFFKHYEKFFRQTFARWGVPVTLLEAITSLKGSLELSGSGKVTVPLQHLDRVPGHKDWVVLYTPGHADTHLAFLHKDDQVLIGGDVLLDKISSNPLLESPYKLGNTRTKPLVLYQNSLKQLKELDVDKVLPGHGHIITNVNELIDERLALFNKRAELVKNMLKHENLTAYDLSKKLYPNQTKGQLLLTMSQTVGYIDLLMESGEITPYEKEQICYYMLTTLEEV